METFQYISDLHIDENKIKDFKSICQSHKSNIDKNLIIAGDVCDVGSTKSRDLYESFIRYCCNIFNNVYLVAGNREYYFSTVEETEKFLTSLEKYKGLHYLNCKEVTTSKGNRIVGCTLWSYVPKESRNKFHSNIKEFGISERDSTFKKHHEYLCKHSKGTIVITHHAPSLSGTIQPKFKGCPTNCLYGSDLRDLIEKSKVWVFGHTHHNTKRGKLLSNPLGRLEEKLDYNKTEMFMI